jgi:hypothetical protein
LRKKEKVEGRGGGGYWTSSSPFPGTNNNNNIAGVGESIITKGNIGRLMYEREGQADVIGENCL